MNDMPIGKIRVLTKDGNILDLTLYAHIETELIGTTKYFSLMTLSSDRAGYSFSCSTGTVGRFVFTYDTLPSKFVYPLKNVVKILSGTIYAVYRAYTGGGTVHCDIDILIRKNDGTVRTTIATDVSISANLGSTWATYKGADYSFPEYTVVDDSDYLEIDFYAHITTRKAAQYCYLRIDDNTLATTDQTRSLDWAFEKISAMEEIREKSFPRLYLSKPIKAQELISKVSNVSIEHITNDYPKKLLSSGLATELRSKWGFYKPLGGLQLREHKRYTAYDPDYTFRKSTSSGYIDWLEMFSSDSSIGIGWIFAVFKRSFLHGKRVKIYANATGSYTFNANNVRIYDGSYDRTSDTDFPSGSDITLKGAGLLKDIAFSTTAGDIVIDTGILDLSAGQLYACTLFICNVDLWAAQNFTLRVQRIEIWDDTKLIMCFRTHIYPVIMERTGTTGDYGYIGSITEPIGEFL